MNYYKSFTHKLNSLYHTRYRGRINRLARRTGNTLKANGMEPLEEIAAISSRLIANKAAMRSRPAIIQRVIDDLAQIVSQQSSGA